MVYFAVLVEKQGISSNAFQPKLRFSVLQQAIALLSQNSPVSRKISLPSSLILGFCETIQGCPMPT